MVHFTSVPEGRDAVDLEAHAAGFLSKPMGFCSFVAAFWNLHGANFQSGRAIHGSGGLGDTDLVTLLNGIQGNALTVVYIPGSTADFNNPNCMDGRFATELQRQMTVNNWPVRRFEYAAKMGDFVVTRALAFSSKDDYDAASQPAPRANAICCIIQ